jgi:hypothetical protein
MHASEKYPNFKRSPWRYRLWQQRAAPPVGGRVHWALREEVTCPTIDSTVDASFD